jgi:hypothetical protein
VKGKKKKRNSSSGTVTEQIIAWASWWLCTRWHLAVKRAAVAALCPYSRLLCYCTGQVQQQPVTSRSGADPPPFEIQSVRQCGGVLAPE